MQTVLLIERIEVGTNALAPQPDAVCRTLALPDALQIDRMIFQHVVRTHHQIIQRCCILAVAQRQIGLDRSACDVVRRCESAQIGGAVIPDQAVPISNTGIEPESIVAQCLFHCLHQDACLFGGDIAGAVVHHGAILIVRLIAQCHQIAAQRNIGGLHVDADASGLQRRTAGVILHRVIAQNREVCHIAARLHAILHGLNQTNGCFLCQSVHVGGIRCLQRGLVSQFLHWIVCHTVTQYYQIFHQISLLHSFWDAAPKFDAVPFSIIPYVGKFVQRFSHTDANPAAAALPLTFRFLCPCSFHRSAAIP